MMEPKVITVSIVEDNQRFSKTLEQIIKAEDGLVFVSSFPNGKSARKQCLVDNADVIIMDIELPDASGIDLVHEFKALRPDKKIVMCTSFGDEERVFQALKNGASGYILKDDTLENIIQAIFDVDAGGAPMSKKIAAMVLNHFHKQGQEVNVLNQLTKREDELLGLLSTGLFYKEVAHNMGIALGTVKKHAGNIYKKLAVNNKTEAINLYTKK